MPWTIIWRLLDGSYLAENRIGPQGSTEAMGHFSLDREDGTVIALIAGTHEVCLEDGQNN
tara:strand:+ start:550 stop:729 length:180 start_codon:yes stop_codon:yes gene_type:complete